ncbi:ABR058Cp [Eremothecium gossypii ATCC 10895]|uniref:ABR058Cp n=1 Tax=Eremothecium gossypii (strain ATCC 10895 / CBS 109.51 / FGSC 9923 / NRRL Y-1056) TaxID=284811 RepID=Q75DG8_EREGS|nr:ABR058Cp [Eremothecium gossypii ATCC 10895]AAS50828.2 ABR058Cp [Eremothecium gossypii ATCC 10895]
MIIFDGEKYSCAACIRGHRSTTCKHSDRMLVKVRTRGRPSPMDIRKVILVDAGSQVPMEDEDTEECCDGGKTCGKMDRQPILFLKALKTQKALLVDGALKIMIEDRANSDGVDKRFKFVTEKEFLLQNADMLEARDGCGCQRPGKRARVGCSTGAGSPHAVEPYTYKGVYLSTQCSCDDSACQCANCLIHRKEEELDQFIRQSGVPLTSVDLEDRKPAEAGACCGDRASGLLGYDYAANERTSCACSPVSCMCKDCEIHAEEVVSMNRLLLHGILNTPLKRKMSIQYKGKLINSKFWWDILYLQCAVAREPQLEALDLLQWFDNIIETHGAALPDAEPAATGLDYMLGKLS